MKNARKTNGSDNNSKTQPIRRKEDVPASNDEHIDQDFPGYPGHPAKENNINPKTRKDKKIANAKDSSYQENKDTSDIDNGSAGAFEATENPRE